MYIKDGKLIAANNPASIEWLIAGMGWDGQTSAL